MSEKHWWELNKFLLGSALVFVVTCVITVSGIKSNLDTYYEKKISSFTKSLHISRIIFSKEVMARSAPGLVVGPVQSRSLNDLNLAASAQSSPNSLASLGMADFVSVTGCDISMIEKIRSEFDDFVEMPADIGFPLALRTDQVSELRQICADYASAEVQLLGLRRDLYPLDLIIKSINVPVRLLLPLLGLFFMAVGLYYAISRAAQMRLAQDYARRSATKSDAASSSDEAPVVDFPAVAQARSAALIEVSLMLFFVVSATYLVHVVDTATDTKAVLYVTPPGSGPQREYSYLTAEIRANLATERIDTKRLVVSQANTLEPPSGYVFANAWISPKAFALAVFWTTFLFWICGLAFWVSGTVSSLSALALIRSAAFNEQAPGEGRGSQSVKLPSRREFVVLSSMSAFAAVLFFVSRPLRSSVGNTDASAILRQSARARKRRSGGGKPHYALDTPQADGLYEGKKAVYYVENSQVAFVGAGFNPRGIVKDKHIPTADIMSRLGDQTFPMLSKLNEKARSYVLERSLLLHLAGTAPIDKSIDQALDLLTRSLEGAWYKTAASNRLVALKDKLMDLKKGVETASPIFLKSRIPGNLTSVLFWTQPSLSALSRAPSGLQKPARLSIRIRSQNGTPNLFLVDKDSKIKL
jgi:hypothetical protein